MEVFFELSRRCNMQCFHCLRGSSQGKDMPSNTIRRTLQIFHDYTHMYGIGGGEPLLNAKIINRFTDELQWINTSNITHIWVVTNGKRLIKQKEFAIPYNSPNYSEEETGTYYENIPLVDSVLRLSLRVEVDLAVSVDKYHEKGATSRYNQIQTIFEYAPNVKVLQHGATGDLLGMGSNAGGGVEEHIYSPSDEDGENLIYVNIHGDIYSSCNLSYNLQDRLKNTILWLGNVHTHTYDQIIERSVYLHNVYSINGNSSILVTEYGPDWQELEELESLYLQDNKIAV